MLNPGKSCTQPEDIILIKARSILQFFGTMGVGSELQLVVTTIKQCVGSTDIGPNAHLHVI